jgi:NADPH2:quinone reductase
MKAIRVHEPGEPEVMKVEEVPDPRPEHGQVVVRVHAAGVNPVDTYIRSGQYPNRAGLPYTPGMDAAGVIEAIGPGVTRVAEGDRVYVAGLTGTYAERVCCPATQVHRLPENVSFAQGAAVGVPYATAYRALFQRAHAVACETVLVHGATGGVGTAAVQIAAAAGMTVIGTGGTDRGRQMVAEQGADLVLDHHDLSCASKLMDATGGRGVDVILEMLADVNLGTDLNLLAPAGRIVVIGCRGTIEINPRLLMGREGAILGMVVMNADEREYASIHAALTAGLANETLRPIIHQELPPAQAPRAHREVMEAKAFGKIVLTP